MSDIPLIAVVDDDEAIREALQSLLRAVGLRAAVFASAEDFLQADQRQATACLIVDVRMPADERPGAPAPAGHGQLSYADHLHHGPWRWRDARAGAARRCGGLFGQTLQR